MGKPFLKWVGGKRALVPEIRRYMPGQFNRYFEPFMGGAALFFDVAPQNAVLSDVNAELVNCYDIVKSQPEALIDALAGHYYDKEYYYQIRDIDRDPTAFAALSKVERAARLLFLNRTGFNGMYRVNRKGQFNVPFGRYANPDIIKAEAIRNAHVLLQNATICHRPFTAIIDHAREGDFVYFDPPYIPLSQTANFTSYAQEDFSYEDQVMLSDICRALDEKGVYFIASNSFHETVKDLYQGFEIIEIKARRAINSHGDKRQAISEALIHNGRTKVNSD